MAVSSYEDNIIQSLTGLTHSAIAQILGLEASNPANVTHNAPEDDVLIASNYGDVLAGGLGNDTYIVSASGVNLIEHENEGMDTLQTYVSYECTLENIEIIQLMGNDALSAVNYDDGTNIMIGNDAASFMAGGLGDDTYVVQNSDTTIYEDIDSGNDIVQSSVTYTLSANLETLALTGNENLWGFGNDMDNLIVGNAGTNVLMGGMGDDTYVIQNPDAYVMEYENEGTDTVISSTDYYLYSEHIENLILTGTDDLEATGNSANNMILGNTGDNELTGQDGNDILMGSLGEDTLSGGAGDDQLYGGSGNDYYWDFYSNFGNDEISDVSGDHDTLDLIPYASTDVFGWEGIDTNNNGMRDSFRMTFDDGSVLSIQNYFDDITGMDTGTGYIEEIVFNDTTMDFSDVLAIAI